MGGWILLVGFMVMVIGVLYVLCFCFVLSLTLTVIPDL